MTKITVRTSGSKIRIRLRDETKAPVVTEPTGAEPLKSSEPVTPGKRALLLSTSFINLMEIRAESIFRPDEEDVEIVYALSGSSNNTPDTFHKLSSGTIVEEATEDHIISSVRGMLEHIKRERESEPKLVVELHTHPQGAARPSEQDRRYFTHAVGAIKTLLADANILFGVHAVSSESIRERQEPHKVSRNIIKWSSITREHEVAFYSPNAEPYEVEILE
ncbi:Mov34/MPN/PAD-1 family protein [Chloroflexota bacterium]